MSTPLISLFHIPWKKRTSQFIGIFYGLISIPLIFILVRTPFVMSIANTIRPGYDFLILLLFFLIIGGTAFVLVLLGIGFWLEKRWAYNAALFIHGLPLVGEALSWINYVQKLDLGLPEAPPILPEADFLIHFFIVGFVLLPRLYNYSQGRQKNSF